MSRTYCSLCLHAVTFASALVEVTLWGDRYDAPDGWHVEAGSNEVEVKFSRNGIDTVGYLELLIGKNGYTNRLVQVPGAPWRLIAIYDLIRSEFGRQQWEINRNLVSVEADTIMDGSAVCAAHIYNVVTMQKPGKSIWTL